MPFAVGDTVIHRYHGPGHITRLDHVQARNGTYECYVVDFGRGFIVWVPIDGVSEQSLRLPVTAPALAELSEILRSPSTPLKIPSKERQQQIRLLMQDGSPTALCTLMRDLTAYAARRVPNASDSAALEKVRGILVAEWALATLAPNAADQVSALLRQSAQSDNALSIAMSNMEAAAEQAEATPA